MKRIYVSRRLLFDDEEKVSLNKPVNQQMTINSHPNDVLKEKVKNNKVTNSAVLIKMRG